jgi:hypothetical protein
MANEIIKVIDELAKRFGIAIDWTNQNILPYLETLGDKFVSYELWTSVTMIVAYILACLVVSIGIKYLNKNKDFGVEYRYGGGVNKECRYFCYTVIAIALIALSYFIIDQVFDIITCLTFPEKIIFEELKVIYGTMK